MAMAVKLVLALPAGEMEREVATPPPDLRELEGERWRRR